MIEVSIPNNIHEYKPKFLLGLTGKQFICITLTAGCILLDFMFLKPYIGDLAVILAAVPAFIAACFGWVQPYGMPFEKYLQSVLFQSMLAPKCRKAKVLDPTIVPCDKYYVEIPDAAVSNEVLECVMQVRESLGTVGEEKTSSSHGQRKNSKTQKPRYKKSKQAFL